MEATLDPAIFEMPTHTNFDFGDRRINKRANFMFDKLSKSGEKTLPEIFNSNADLKGAYRFLNNDLVTPEKILKPHSLETINRCKEQKLVSVTQDSSDFDFDYLECLEGFESLHPNVDKGFRIHPLLVSTESGTPLGILNTFNYTRNKDELPKKHRNSLKIEDKESYRWLWGYRETCKLAEQLPGATVVSVADREGDIYECLSEAQDVNNACKADILVRSNHNRCLEGVVDETNNKLEKKLIRSSVRYEGKLRLNQYRKNDRTANIVVRASKVLIKAPNTCKKKSLPSIEMNAVLVSEVDPLKGEEPLHWLLLTTLPIDTEDDIRRIISLYSNRWGIEIYFKVMKSGCKTDSVHLQTTSRIENFIAFAMIVAWRVMLTTYLPREYPKASCTVLFSEIEWKLVYNCVYKGGRDFPKDVPTLREVVILVAMLGGYQKRKAPPGIQTVWRGIIRLMDMVCGYELSEKLRLSL